MPADTLDESVSDSSTDDFEVSTTAAGETPTVADSSPAAGEEPDLLSVVRDVVKESAPTDSPSGEPEAKAGETGEQQTQKDGTEDYSDVPFNKHPRFRQLLGELKSAKVHAERSQNIEAFLQQTGVSDQEAANALEVIAMAKHQPAAAWERLKPWLQDLAIRAGEVLPEDLQTRVGTGEMSREAAIELAKARAQTTSLEEIRKFEREQQESRRTAELASALQTEVVNWEAARQQADPNFDKKLPYIQKEIVWRHRNGDKPTTPDGVKQQLDDVYKEVSKQLAPILAPMAAKPRPAVKPVMGGQVASADLKTKPQSTLDVVRNAAEAMRQSA